VEPIRALASGALASAEAAPAPADDPLRTGRLCLELASPLRTLVRCRVCGFSEVHTDEVLHRGTLILAECPRCEHRWTAPAEAPRSGPGVRRVRAVRPARAADGEAAAAA
jgi:hypothetical protein